MTLAAAAGVFVLLTPGANATPKRSDASSTSSLVNIKVYEAGTDPALSVPVDNFKWMINVDNSHDAASTSIVHSYSPYVAAGDETNAVGISVPDGPLTDSKGQVDRGYLVTVLANDGVGDHVAKDYKIGGKHFKLPDDAGDIVVELVPHPLPLAAIKARVFHDNRWVNGEWDFIAPAAPEPGIAGFKVTIEDRLGEVTTDWFGNPLCTAYADLSPPAGFGPEDLDVDGNPTPIPGTGGQCLTGSDGIATIPNLGPDKYAVEAIRPPASSWILTATIEGTKHNDAWIEEGSRGFATDAEAGLFTRVWFGFVKPCAFGSTTDDCLTNQAVGTGTIKGQIFENVLDITETTFVNGRPIPFPYVALSNFGADDEQVVTIRGDANGNFLMQKVPAGFYALTVWDEANDYIIFFKKIFIKAGQTVLVTNASGTPGLGVFGWFGKMRGSVYLDANGNGLREKNELPLTPFDLDSRFKDGSIWQGTVTDVNGNYVFPEVTELEQHFISEVGYSRFKQTGVAVYRTDAKGFPLNYPWKNDCRDYTAFFITGGGPNIPGCVVGSAVRECATPADWKTCEHGPINQDSGLASLLQSTFLPAGHTLYFDWGKKPFAANENGGIVGIAFNDVTRNELDASLMAAEDYEPGIPGVTVNLYAPQKNPDGTVKYDPVTGEVLKDHIVNTVATDGFFENSPTDCIPTGSFGRSPTQVQPYPDIWDKCLEFPSLFPQVKFGVFDGGYAFEEDCTNPAAADPLDPAELLADCATLGAARYVVEVVPPAGHRPAMEEDINVFSGDVLTPTVPFPPCVGPKHTVHVVDKIVDAAFDPADPSNTSGVYNPDFLATPVPAAPSGFGSPFEGLKQPLCNEKLVTLSNGFNANSDFFLWTDAANPGGGVEATGYGVPQPGKLYGLVFDDLTLELDPSKPNYAEKKGVPDIPVGIRDYTGKLLEIIYTDANGIFTTDVPSTGSFNCPLPAGPCPGMWNVVGNDPGDITNPDPKFNPNYDTLPLFFDVWPGLTTIADVAISPVAFFVKRGPAPQPPTFDTPPRCDVPAATPALKSISRPYGKSTDGGNFTLTGTGFGASTGTVTLDGTAIGTASWSNTTITVPFANLAAVADGPHQLLIKTSLGVTGQSGITFHKLGAGYDPTQVHVDIVAGNDATGTGSAGAPYKTLQKGLDSAPADALVLVHPGVYFDHFIMDKNVKLQGYGSGAVILDGRFLVGTSGDQLDWEAKVAATPYTGAPIVPWGQVITILATDGEFHSGLLHAQVDGLKIANGRNERGNGLNPNQGGGVYAHGYARYLEISNNWLTGNAGSRGGAIILGLPTDYHGISDAQNDNITMHHNRIVNNGGKVHSGSVGFFNGTQNYDFYKNFVCGGYAKEYGAGVSHFGYSPGGKIRDNQIIFNNAFDEGGGIMIGGQFSPAFLSGGSGQVTVERNLIQFNFSNDDGGGIRLLNPTDGKVTIRNNIIANNGASDLGGGISLDDALDVTIVNNTIARNVSTATGEAADRSCNILNVPFLTCPHAAGIDAEGHSTLLLDAVKAGAYNCAVVDCVSNFTDPKMFNNIFWRNLAYNQGGAFVSIDPIPLDPACTPLTPPEYPCQVFDFEVLQPGVGTFDARYSICTGFNSHCPNDGTNKTLDPLFVQSVDLMADILAFAGDPSFVFVLLRSSPGDPPGNYHLTGASPAINMGAAVSGFSPSVSKAPTSATIEVGTLVFPSTITSLKTADNNNYIVRNGSSGGTKMTRFFGTFSGVPAGITSLIVSTKVSQPAGSIGHCVHTIQIWNTTGGGFWETLPGTLGPTDTVFLVPRALTRTVGGTLSNYVDGGGNVKVRLTCTKGSDFRTQTDLLSIAYKTAPVGGTPAPADDFDTDVRPQSGLFDIGADEYKP